MSETRFGVTDRTPLIADALMIALVVGAVVVNVRTRNYHAAIAAVPVGIAFIVYTWRRISRLIRPL